MQRAALPTTLHHSESVVLSLRAEDWSGLDGQLSAEGRQKLLSEVRAGNPPAKITLEAITFLQRETPNRNFVRFKDGLLSRLASSFAGAPFLRDHDRSLEARGGTVVSSELVQHRGRYQRAGNEVPAFKQTIELVKPWAIEAALDGTIDRFSIGWSITGDILCTACGNDMFSRDCSHYPGQTFEREDGTEAKVEALITEADGVETSAVTVPAVKGTSVDEIRAALEAARATEVFDSSTRTWRQFVAGGATPMKTLIALLGLSESADAASIEAAAVAKLEK